MRSIEQPGRSFLSIAALAALPALTGCSGYTSSYMPLEDGRARAVYRDDKLVLEIGGSITPQCADAIAEPSSAVSSSYVSANARVGVWVPMYFGPRIVVVHRGVAPAPRRPTYVGSRPTFTRSGGGPSSGASSSGGVGGGGSGGLDKEAAVILAVIAIVALPAITLGLALGRPEPEKEVSEVLDRVNLYNDLARSPGSPCAVAAPSAPSAPMGGAP